MIPLYRVYYSGLKLKKKKRCIFLTVCIWYSCHNLVFDNIFIHILCISNSFYSKRCTWQNKKGFCLLKTTYLNKQQQLKCPSLFALVIIISIGYSLPCSSGQLWRKPQVCQQTAPKYSPNLNYVDLLKMRIQTYRPTDWQPRQSNDVRNENVYNK